MPDVIETPPQQKNWLQRLKDESWEAELLVSAVAIFAILNSFGLVDWMVDIFIEKLNPNQYGVAYFIVVTGYLAIGILAAMFSLHFALRAYWIGLVGLNSVFPDYSLDDSAFSPIYTKKMLGFLPKLSDAIDKVDELCSVIFSAAFALMLIYTYLTLLAILYLLLYNSVVEYVPSGILLIPLYILGIFVFSGMIIGILANLKKFKHHENIQHTYFLFGKWNGYLLYGPLHKSVLMITMIFGTNFKKKKSLVRLVLIMFTFGFAFTIYKMTQSNYHYLINADRTFDDTREYPEFYQNLNQGQKFLLGPEIHSNQIEGKTLQLFLPVFDHESKSMYNSCNILTLKKEAEENDKLERWRQNTECLQNHHELYLDGEGISFQFLKTEHSRTGQFGLLAFIDVSHLSTDLHRLRIKRTIDESNTKEWVVPFYYSGK